MPSRRPPADASDRNLQRWFRMLFASALVVTAALLAVSGVAHADPVFTPPQGVSEYRLLFVTADVIDADSSDISYYNDFATSEAALNGALPATTWTAIVTTPFVNAVDNVSCGATCDANVPIYLVDGTSLVATSANALFAGSLSSAPNEDQYGNNINASGIATYTWTGSSASGGPIQGASGLPHDAGDAFVQVGDTGVASSYAIEDMTGGADYAEGTDPSDGNLLPIYAISDLIVADTSDTTDIPEPASPASVITAGLALTWIFRRRRGQPAAAIT